MRAQFATATILFLGFLTPAMSGPQQDAALNHYEAQAKKIDPGFKGFSTARGEKLYFSKQGTGKPDTPSCTRCHTSSPQNSGQTRAGKLIQPMAVSKSPGRYTDLVKLEKWFLRNCKGVLGRECSAMEKGDFITFMSSQ